MKQKKQKMNFDDFEEVDLNQKDQDKEEMKEQDKDEKNQQKQEEEKEQKKKIDDPNYETNEFWLNKYLKVIGKKVNYPKLENKIFYSKDIEELIKIEDIIPHKAVDLRMLRQRKEAMLVVQ